MINFNKSRLRRIVDFGSIGLISLFLLTSVVNKMALKQPELSPGQGNIKIQMPRTNISDKSIIAYYNFDNSIGIWHENSLCCSWSGQLDKTIKRAGNSSLRVELRINDSINGGHRAELGMAPNKNKEGWFAFSTYFPSSFAKDPIEECFVQFQAQPDFSLGENWRSPPFLLGVLKDHFVLDVRSSPKRVNLQNDFTFTRIDLGLVDKQNWIDWVLHIKWAYDNTGTIELWKNNKLVVSRTKLPNSYNDEFYPYFKIGIYKWDWGHIKNTPIKDRVMYLDEVTIGNSSATYSNVYSGRRTLPQQGKIQENPPKTGGKPVVY